ncbi:hypothetical protein ACOT81_22985 [Streptomyces sp. WI04-05B]|uniref:hypothetical protein n=1 Tax=Streptomyces TaxID=1883 RepID=UPI0029A39C9E|nr:MULTISPECIES: hypothetical protein [unclassified Streptomyces]MDX2543068.1 hypothetical protein [Streptomyces sp. WI04-05B]MDX2584891.1 hypothetical protein [Streptomyces sp. WI04-05A]
MRALVSRSGPRSRGLLLPSSVVCAALIFGPVGTAAAVSDASRDAYASIGARTSWSFASVASSTASPYADRMLKRLGALDRADRSDVLAPVLNVLTDLTRQTGTGRLTATQAAGFAEAVESAKASLKQRLADRTGRTNRVAAAMADPVSDLLDQLQATLSGLLDTVTGLVGGLLGTVTGLVSGLLDTLGNLLGGLLGSLPPLPVDLPPVALPPLELPPAPLPAPLTAEDETAGYMTAEDMADMVQ